MRNHSSFFHKYLTLTAQFANLLYEKLSICVNALWKQTYDLIFVLYAVFKIYYNHSYIKEGSIRRLFRSNYIFPKDL